MAVTISLIIFSGLAIVVFVLAFVGVLHIVLIKTVNYGITLYFSERKKYMDTLMKDEVMLKMNPETNIH